VQSKKHLGTTFQPHAPTLSATMHSVTDRPADDSMMPIADILRIAVRPANKTSNILGAKSVYLSELVNGEYDRFVDKTSHGGGRVPERPAPCQVEVSDRVE